MSNNPYENGDISLEEARLYYQHRQRVSIDDLIGKVTNLIVAAMDKGKDELLLDVPFRVEAKNRDFGCPFTSGIVELFDKKQLEDELIPVLLDCGYTIEMVPWGQVHSKMVSLYTHCLKIKL